MAHPYDPYSTAGNPLTQAGWSPLNRSSAPSRSIIPTQEDMERYRSLLRIEGAAAEREKIRLEMLAAAEEVEIASSPVRALHAFAATLEKP